MARLEKSIKNIGFAFMLQAVTTLSNFILRTIMIRSLGIQAVSLNGLFTEVLAALSLAEMGVGSAIVYNLYKPLAEQQKEKVCQLMGLFRTAYRVIAAVTLVIGVAVCPWVHYLIKSAETLDYSLNYIRAVYLLFVMDLSVSYLFSYKTSLMIADQKNYILSKLSMGITIVSTTVKVAILMITKNFIAYMIAGVALTLIANFIRSYVVDRVYPWLKKNKEMLPAEERKEVFANIKNLFIKSLSGKITSSTDNILISSLVSIIQVGIYSNYSLVIGVFRQVANQIAYGGISASLGNLLVSEDNEKCRTVFFRLMYMFYVIASISTVCIYCSVDAFIMLWIKDEAYLLNESIIFICCINLFIEILNRPLWSIMEVSGLFREDKYISIIGSSVNLVVSVVLGLKLGILGIFIGTFLTYFIQAVLKAGLLFRKRLNSTPRKYYVWMFLMGMAVLAQLAVSKLVCSYIHIEESAVRFVVYGIISLAITAGSILLCTFKMEACRYYLGLVKNMLKINRRK